MQIKPTQIKTLNQELSVQLQKIRNDRWKVGLNTESEQIDEAPEHLPKENYFFGSISNKKNSEYSQVLQKFTL